MAGEQKRVCDTRFFAAARLGGKGHGCGQVVLSIPELSLDIFTQIHYHKISITC